MDVANILKYMFPNAVPQIDYKVQDDGDGDYIKEWNVEGEQQPSIQDLTDNEQAAISARDSILNDIAVRTQNRLSDGTDFASNQNLSQFRDATPQQLEDFVNANVTDLASAKNVLKKIARVLQILVRRSDLE